jgi:putative transposase
MKSTLELCHWVYNETLVHRKTAWDREHKSISNFDTHNLLPRWKQEHPELKNVYSQVLQEVQERVDLAFKAFFKRVKRGEKPGYPRFKGKRRYDSFTYPQHGFRLDESKELLKLSKIGDVPIRLHRKIRGMIKRVNINRRATGKWFACFTVDYESNKPPFKDDKIVGIDVGIESFATFSTGEKVENPRFFISEERSLARAQRKLSGQEKGMLCYNKARKVIARIHERMSNKRLDFAHQLSRALVKRFGIIAFEDLNVMRMIKNHHLAKHIADVAWTQFITFTQNKAEEAGSVVVLVKPNNTSQMCSRCGLLIKKELAERTHICHECGLVLDRDHNAAINILRLGIQSLGIKSLEAVSV